MNRTGGTENRRRWMHRVCTLASGLALALLMSSGSARAQNYTGDGLLAGVKVLAGAGLTIPASSTLMFGSMDLSDAIGGKRMPVGLAATELVYGGLQAIVGGAILGFTADGFARGYYDNNPDNSSRYWLGVGTAMLVTGGWFVGHGIYNLRNPEHRLRRLPSVTPLLARTKKGAVGGLSVLF
jgi:hypothetical protein